MKERITLALLTAGSRSNGDGIEFSEAAEVLRGLVSGVPYMDFVSNLSYRRKICRHVPGQTDGESTRIEPNHTYRYSGYSYCTTSV